MKDRIRQGSGLAYKRQPRAIYKIKNNKKSKNKTNCRRTPYLCRPRSRSVLQPVSSTPTNSGMWNRIFNAKAVPITAYQRNREDIIYSIVSGNKQDYK